MNESNDVNRNRRNLLSLTLNQVNRHRWTPMLSKGRAAHHPSNPRHDIDGRRRDQPVPVSSTTSKKKKQFNIRSKTFLKILFARHLFFTIKLQQRLMQLIYRADSVIFLNLLFSRWFQLLLGTGRTSLSRSLFWLAVKLKNTCRKSHLLTNWHG